MRSCNLAGSWANNYLWVIQLTEVANQMYTYVWDPFSQIWSAIEFTKPANYFFPCLIVKITNTGFIMTMCMYRSPDPNRRPQFGWIAEVLMKSCWAGQMMTNKLPVRRQWSWELHWNMETTFIMTCKLQYK